VHDVSALDKSLAEGALLVNATPIGMTGGAEAAFAAFPVEMIESARAVFDVVAVPIDTPLIREARNAGRATINGGEVLVLQGLEQFALYTGVRPGAAQVAEAAAGALAP
jgi:shikimate dehydrogenase